MTDLTETPATAPALAPADRGFVFAVARRFVPTADDAEDVTQDALLLAHRHRASFRGDSRYRTWLYRIAVTTALGYLRRARRGRAVLVDGDPALEVADPAESPESAVASGELRALIRRALAELPPLYREVLLARDDTSVRELATRTGLSVANVKIRAHRARKQLRAAFDRLEARAAADVPVAA